MKEITKRQREIFNYLREHHRTHSCWPSIREIQERFGFKSSNASLGHIRALERKGFIRRNPNQARTFRIEKDPDGQPVTEPDVIEIPIYGSIPAGYPDNVESGGAIGRLQIDVETARVGRNSRTFALKVRGDSMVDAGICDGDIVIVEEIAPKHRDIVAALIDNETTLKRFMHEPGRKPYLKAENVLYPSLFPATELIVQGVAKAVVRSL